MDQYSQIAAIVAPVYIAVAAGAVWHRTGGAFNRPLIAAIVENIGLPCLIVVTFARGEFEPATLARFAVAAVGCLAAWLAICKVWARSDPSMRDGRLAAFAEPETAATGLLVAWLAFGDTGLGLALTFFAIGRTAALIARGRGKVLRSPIPYAMLIAIGLEILQLGPPQFAMNTAGLLAGVVIPAQLLAIGVALASTTWSWTIRDAGWAASRIAAGSAVGYFLGAPIGLGAVAACVLVLQSSMPFAMTPPDNPSHPAVPLSHLLSLLSLPAILILLG